jgi:hypothetical protein
VQAGPGVAVADLMGSMTTEVPQVLSLAGSVAVTGGGAAAGAAGPPRPVLPAQGGARRAPARRMRRSEVLFDTGHAPLPSRSLLSPRWMGDIETRLRRDDNLYDGPGQRRGGADRTEGILSPSISDWQACADL